MKEEWVLLAMGAAFLALEGARKRAEAASGAQPPPPGHTPAEPVPPEEGEVVPPPERPPYVIEPAPQPPGPVVQNADGTWSVDHAGVYQASVRVDSPSWLLNETVVAHALAAEGFAVNAIKRTAPQQFWLEAVRTGPTANLTEPPMVTIESLERIR